MEVIISLEASKHFYRSALEDDNLSCMEHPLLLFLLLPVISFLGVIFTKSMKGTIWWSILMTVTLTPIVALFIPIMRWGQISPTLGAFLTVSGCVLLCILKIVFMDTDTWKEY